MNYKFWLFLDDTLNKFSYHTKFLLKRTQADINNSPKDILIYEQLKNALNITPFEKKINETGAYRNNWTSSPQEVFIPISDPDVEAYRLQWLKEHNVDVTLVRWTTEELIHLHQYKTTPSMTKRMHDIVKAYHKSHFLMSIGVL